MIHDSDIRKSLEEYIKRRIAEIPSEISQTFPKIKQIWKCQNAVDFLYGYYVGKIEEGSIHYLIKVTRAPCSYATIFEIKEIIETFKQELRHVIQASIDE